MALHDDLKVAPIALWLGGKFSNLPRASRMALLVVCAAFSLICMYGTREITEVPKEIIAQHVFPDQGGRLSRFLKGSTPSVNLVVAATSTEDYSWTKEVKLPGMVVVPYIADDLNATHHAQRNKGHEAMMYHQYFYDFYDDLPDVSILIHSQQLSWHVEQLLDQSMIFSLNHLDVREVQRRQFLNLRVTWGVGCSTNTINTTRVNEEDGSTPEQKEMQEAFRANFNVYEVPEILATPCCSQIAVTREAIRRVPREQYAHHIDWLLATELDDSISGRTWEHMWQYLFLGKAIDCPLEHRAYCLLYHICFGGREEYDEWIELNQGRQRLEEELRKINGEGGQETEEEKAEEKNKLSETEQRLKQKSREWLESELQIVSEAIRVRREVAIVRGAVERNRLAEGEPLYGSEEEPGVEVGIFSQETPAPTMGARARGTALP
ncbi:hypothetical protein QTJ16_005974 [Diplocarpon rosae]|uniref:Uncharacterized protein n=1 Tax=Diplocarpon rosae TaxID=946125 RepID=A0AAD9WCW8_9HELO|nr:hypothetical protein QTJ16_005974 [Diplocarpon rosae]